MNLQESIRRILREERNISDIIKIAAKEYNCSTWEINNGYCEDFALNVLEKLGGYEDNLFELSGDMFFDQRDPEFAKENWGDVIETNYGVWSKNLLDYWGYPPNVNLNLVDDEINHVWLFYNGKHYDAEVPEGVDNWFEIPLIKRLFNRYKKNMVQESIRRILKEETEDMSPLEQTVADFINMNLTDYELPEEFYKVAVDIFDTEYNRKECTVTILFEKPFNLKDSDRMHDIINEIKKEIKEYFGDTFWYIKSGTSTVDVYNSTKDWYKKRKNK